MPSSQVCDTIRQLLRLYDVDVMLALKGFLDVDRVLTAVCLGVGNLGGSLLIFAAHRDAAQAFAAEYRAGL